LVALDAARSNLQSLGIARVFQLGRPWCSGGSPVFHPYVVGVPIRRSVGTSAAAWLIGAAVESIVASADAAAPVGASLPSPVAAQPGETVSLTRGGESVSARLERDTISGPQIALRRYGNKWRGTIEGQSAELRWEPGISRVMGAIGDRPVDLAFAGGRDTLEIWGKFGVREARLVVNATKVEGIVGPCRYRLHFEGDHYKGQVDCGGTPVQATLRIPASLAAQPRTEFVALLVSFFGI
jgi:hypothetical protein